MKKVIGLCVVILLSSVSVFAQADNNRRGRNRDGKTRFERFSEDLKLDEKQKAEVLKINEAYAEKMKADRDAQREKMKAEREERRRTMTAMRDRKNEEVKKVLTEEQYRQYLEKQQRPEREKVRAKTDKPRLREKGNRDYRPHHRGNQTRRC